MYFCDLRAIENKEKQKFQKGTLGRNYEVHLVEPHYENRCKMIATKDMEFFFLGIGHKFIS